MHPTSANRVEHVEVAILRALMVAMGAGVWFTGFSLLTSPLAIPITVGLWGGAAAMAWLGIFGELPTDCPGQTSHPTK